MATVLKNRCRDRRLRLGWGDHGQRADRSGPQRRRAGARPDARHRPDGAYPQVIDELTYNIRRKLFRDLSKSTVTIRHNTSQQAVPYRQLAAFLPGTGVGGAGLHWSGVHFRVDPIELRMRSHYEERYGKNFIPVI